MSIVIPGETLDCDNIKLQLLLSTAGNPTDPFILEYQIFEVVTTPPTPVQVYPLPAGTRATVDIANLCPTGDKISTGQFLAQWPLVPLAEPQGGHQIKWFFKLLSTSAEQEECVPFQVLSFVATPGAADVVALKCRYPLLEDRGDKLIGLAIEEARRQVNVTCFGDRAVDAIYALAAHLIEMSTNPALATGTTQITTGSESVQFGQLTAGGQFGFDRTSYGQAYLRLQFLAGPGARVLC